MPSIEEVIAGKLDQIDSSYRVNVSGLNEIFREKSTEIRGEGKFIHSFTPIPLTETSLIAIDGGNAMDSLSEGDLFVAGATIGEGYESRKAYESHTEYPAEAYMDFLPHQSSNDALQKTVRALSELRILGKTNADLTIIDGAYSGNIANLFYSLVDEKMSNYLMKLNDKDADGFLWTAVKSLLVPAANELNTTVGIVKNDSSVVYSKEFLQGTRIFTTDRNFTSKLLKPGEFVTPRAIENAVPGLSGRLIKKTESTQFRNQSVDKPKLELLKHYSTILNERFTTTDATQQPMLYTTYFKPSKWFDDDRSIKIEFIHHHDSSTTPTVVETAQTLIGLVDADIHPGPIMEPYAQYDADLRAKGVSASINMAKSHLLAQHSSEDDRRGLMSGSRTSK